MKIYQSRRDDDTVYRAQPRYTRCVDNLWTTWAIHEVTARVWSMGQIARYEAHRSTIKT